MSNKEQNNNLQSPILSNIIDINGKKYKIR